MGRKQNPFTPPSFTRCRSSFLMYFLLNQRHADDCDAFSFPLFLITWFFFPPLFCLIQVSSRLVNHLFFHHLHSFITLNYNESCLWEDLVLNLNEQVCSTSVSRHISSGEVWHESWCAVLSESSSSRLCLFLDRPAAKRFLLSCPWYHQSDGSHVGSHIETNMMYSLIHS